MNIIILNSNKNLKDNLFIFPFSFVQIILIAFIIILLSGIIIRYMMHNKESVISFNDAIDQIYLFSDSKVEIKYNHKVIYYSYNEKSNCINFNKKFKHSRTVLSTMVIIRAITDIRISIDVKNKINRYNFANIMKINSYFLILLAILDLIILFLFFLWWNNIESKIIINCISALSVIILTLIMLIWIIWSYNCKKYNTIFLETAKSIILGSKDELSDKDKKELNIISKAIKYTFAVPGIK